MRVLALDTTLSACSVAFAVDGRIAGHSFEQLGHGHAERLMPMLEAARQESGLDYRDLDLIAVTVGPGTFTGVRIGLAAARALALPHGVPVAGVSTLQALAWGAGPGSPIIAAIDARREQFYLQTFSGTLEPLTAAILGMAEDALRATAGTPGPWRLVGSGSPALSTLPQACEADAASEPDAATIARHAADLLPDAAVAWPPSPLYLRPPDARLPTARPAPRPGPGA